MDRAGDLQIEQDLAFQEREWRFERFGWAALFALVTAGALGLFGHGPISWTSVSTDDGALEVRFERFGRNGGNQELVLDVAASAAEAGTWEINISRDYLGVLEVNSITPEPDAVESLGDELRYTFAQADPGADLRVSFDVTPDGLWRQSGRIGIAGGSSVRVTHFFVP